MGLFSVLLRIVKEISVQMLSSFARKSSVKTIKTLESALSTHRHNARYSYSIEEKHNAFVSYKKAAKHALENHDRMKNVNELWVTLVFLMFCTVVGCRCIYQLARNKSEVKLPVELNDDPLQTLAYSSLPFFGQWNKYAPGIRVLTSSYKPRVSFAPEIDSGEAEVRTLENQDGYADVVGFYSDDVDAQDVVSSVDILRKLTMRGKHNKRIPDIRPSSLLSESYIVEAMSFLSLICLLGEPEVKSLLNEVLQKILSWENSELEVGVLGFLCKVNYEGENESLSRTMDVIRTYFEAKLLDILEAAITHLPESRSTLDLAIDMVLYSEDNEIEETLLSEFLRHTLDIVFSKPISICSQTIMQSYARLVYSLDLNTYQETFLQRSFQYFHSPGRSDLKSLEVVRTMKTYMVCNQKKVQEELIKHTLENKSETLAYTNMKVFHAVIPIIVYDAETSQEIRALQESGLFYLALVQVLADHSLIPLVTQIDILANYISPIYKLLKENLKLSRTDLQPPVLQGVQLSEALFL